MDEEQAVGLPEMAHILGVSADTVRRYAALGEIPAFRVGRLWRFWPSQVREHLQQQVAQRDPWARNPHMRGAPLGWERRHARGR